MRRTSHHDPCYGDRFDAARALLSRLGGYGARADVVVIGLARGGVPVAAVIAAGLGVELDVAVVRKLGAPSHAELALGAITSSHLVLNDDLVAQLGVSRSQLDEVIEREQTELQRRESAYRHGRAATPVAGRTVILVDDGMATGSTMRAAVLDMRAGGAARIVVAVPAAPHRAEQEFDSVPDEFICPHTPRDFQAVGLCYRDFRQVGDDEVSALMARSSR